MGNTCRQPGSGTDDSLTSADDVDLDIQSLVLPPRAVRFPSAGSSTSERSAGSYLLFLEQAQNLLYPGQAGGLSCDCAAGPSRRRGQPSVKAWVQDGQGNAVGTVASWPAKGSGTNPVWYSARPLGASVSSGQACELQIELWEDNSLLGSTAVALANVPLQQTVVRQLEMPVVVPSPSKPAPCQLSFQLLSSQSLRGRRVVYFIRHGQSVWNKAQGQMQLHEMARTVDHPLSHKGRKQAEALSRRIAKAEKQADPSVQALLLPEVVLVSPLARAIQTAVIALGPMMTRPGLRGEMVLMSSAREKQNFGGLDTKSTRVGADVLRNTFDELRLLYEGDESTTVETFGHLRFDTQDVEDQWWFEGMAESSSELKERLQEFMSQLLYTPHTSMIVVGHSHFFRAVFREFLSEDASMESPELTRSLTSKKLMNCGVARVELDPSRGLTGGPIVSAQLVLDTRLEGEGGMLACCAAGPGSSGSPASRDEEVFMPGAAESYPGAASGLQPPL